MLCSGGEILHEYTLLRLPDKTYKNVILICTTICTTNKIDLVYT
jgi:hypothetical protein